MSTEEDLHQYLLETTRFKHRLGLTLPKNYHYLGGEDYVLDRGSLFQSQALTKAERTAILDALQSCSVKRFQMGHCFYNTQMLIGFSAPDTFQYCEGWAIGFVGLPTLHAWLIINGKIFDPTWRTERPTYRGKLSTRIWGTFPETWAYYGAIFHTAEVVSRLSRIKVTGSFLDDIAFGFPLFQEPRLRSLSDILNRNQ